MAKLKTNMKNRFTALPLAFIGILLLATFPGWHEVENGGGSDREVKPFPYRQVSRLCLAIVFVSAIFQFVSVFWQHIAAASTAAMIETLSYGTIKSHVGLASMVLAWIAFGVTTIAMIGLLIIILSIRALTLDEAYGGSSGSGTHSSLHDD